MIDHSFLFFFFFNDTATTEIYTLSLHDALPICTVRVLATRGKVVSRDPGGRPMRMTGVCWDITEEKQAEERLRALMAELERRDRKSTRLNSSHSQISYAVFCLKEKKQEQLSHT